MAPQEVQPANPLAVKDFSLKRMKDALERGQKHRSHPNAPTRRLAAEAPVKAAPSKAFALTKRPVKRPKMQLAIDDITAG